MKTVFFILSFLVLTIHLSAQEIIQFPNNLDPKASYEVILLAGQSNMEGLGKVSDLSPMNFENIHFFDYGLNSNMKKSSGNFGPEIGLAKTLQKNFPDRKFIFIKYAVGGSSLLDWAPKYDAEKAKITGHPEFGNMYARLMELTDSLTNGLKTEPVAILWMQGERDARVPEAGKDYYKNFKHLIQSLRKDLDHKSLPLLFGKVNPPRQTYLALETVNRAQVKTSKKIKNTFLISTDNLDKLADNLHYSSQGQLELGERFGEKLLDILKEN
ncbi:sialate O-acetylesterase [Algoriphagus sp. PAP.12]|uniref:sialate O-acetylesterase n=1 Tax=Algoriphagus sp. PAP.12 TaxID=2996678 RepID=UPI00227CA566|nr:sialate O-acetylesterase [Algoriphagus sp. PAP.12]